MFKNLPKLPHLLLPILTLLLISSGILSAQSDLVRWNNSGFTPTLVVNNINASNIIVSGGVSITHLAYNSTEDFFQFGNLSTPQQNSGGPDTSRYIEFTITASTGFKIDLNQFNFTYRAQGSPQNFQVRYSKDNFATYYTSIANTVVNGNWTNAAGNISSVNPVLPGETVKIRVYAYNTWNNFHIKRVFDSTIPTNHSQTPRITGTVSSASSANLSVTKTVNTPNPIVGSNVKFTIGANNIGATNATNVRVNDLLPSGYQYISDNASGAYVPGTGIWTIGNLAASGSRSLEITAKVLPTGNHLNTATIASNETDTNPSDNTASATTTPIIPNADVAVTSEMNNLEPTPGNSVIYTINVKNNGPDATTGVSLNNQLPSGFTYQNHTTATGTYNSGTGIWTIGNLASGATVALQVTAQMQNVGPYTQTAAASHYGNDANATNNTASATPSNVCGNCTHALPNGGGHIDVLSDQTYCLHSGTFTGTINIQAGGTVCIASGANFNPSGGGNLFNGNIINRGNMTFEMFNNTTHTVNIVNNGNFNSSSIQNFAGSILNNGTMNITSGGYVQFLTGASLQNYNNMNLLNAHFTNATVHNYGNLSVNNGLTVTGGYWDNHFDGEISINMNSSGSTMTFNGDFDNSGLWRFDRIGNLGGLVNNYAHIQVYNAVNNISNETYLTNDGLLEFINIANIEFNGPMLTNNGDILLTHSSDGNFKMNQAINQVFNNGLISVSGNFEQNAAHSTLVNNCRIITKNFMAREGNTTNSGIINATQNVEIHGNSNFRNNNITSRIQGLNFDNDGVIRGFGSFYFTGYTDNSGGEIYGDDASNPINFYDTTQANPSLIFDSDGGSITDNIIRPLSMQQVDFNTYICTAPPTVAGYPPTTEDLNYSSSTPGVVIIPLTGHAFPHSDVNGQQFTLMYNSIRLFEFGNPNNPTNNSTTLVIPGKGTFTVNTSNGEITFTPEAGFNNGTVTAEYRMSNRWNGTPPIHPGSRKKITISFNTISAMCYKDPNTDEPAEEFTSAGVSTLSETSKGWPENVPNGYLAFESKNKGFVITRVPNENSITQPKEGMLIYDIQARCVKLHNGTDWRCIQKKCD